MIQRSRLRTKAGHGAADVAWGGECVMGRMGEERVLGASWGEIIFADACAGSQTWFGLVMPRNTFFWGQYS